jgi:hypothetical protein
MWFHASNMIMNVHLDALYLLEADACSRACGHFFMGWSPIDGDPIQLNGAFFTLCASSGSLSLPQPKPNLVPSCSTAKKG